MQYIQLQSIYIWKIYYERFFAQLFSLSIDFFEKMRYNYFINQKRNEVCLN